MKYILMRLKEVQDPRQLGKIKHVLSDILAMCIISIMCGAKSTHQIHMFVQCREEWFRRFLEMPNGVPNRLTINRVLSLIRGGPGSATRRVHRISHPSSVGASGPGGPGAGSPGGGRPVL